MDRDDDNDLDEGIDEDKGNDRGVEEDLRGFDLKYVDEDIDDGIDKGVVKATDDDEAILSCLEIDIWLWLGLTLGL